MKRSLAQFQIMGHSGLLTAVAGGPSVLLTTVNTARILGVSPRTVRLWAECQILPAFKFGKQWRFDEELLRSWIESRDNQSNGRLDQRFTRMPNGTAAIIAGKPLVTVHSRYLKEL